mmetsp:Transcript_6850/g.22450  ORF Transcript_6850/g.22450 Transcript_6850/m.22450 type:complete len:200 (+) Transcript_6850:587-1186(+)
MARTACRYWRTVCSHSHAVQQARRTGSIDSALPGTTSCSSPRAARSGARTALATAAAGSDRRYETDRRGRAQSDSAPPRKRQGVRSTSRLAGSSSSKSYSICASSPTSSHCTDFKSNSVPSSATKTSLTSCASSTTTRMKPSRGGWMLPRRAASIHSCSAWSSGAGPRCSVHRPWKVRQVAWGAQSASTRLVSVCSSLL